MGQVWKVARREFRSYFDHPTAYVLVVAFLAVTLFLGFRSLYASGVATLRPVIGLLPWVLAVFVPAITMRSVAEERRTGTLEWLMAQPVDEVQVVLGKFLGDWMFALVALAGLVPSGLGLLAVSSADPGILVAQLIGAGLLSATLVGIGMFASSATRNQITAFILGAVVAFALVLAGTSFTLQGLPPAVAGPVGRLSVLTHFENVARGVLDLRDVLYFVTSTALFLALAYFLIARERLSPRRGAYRRLRIGVAAIVGGVVLINLLGHRFHGRLDLTRNDLYTLSEGTKKVLSRVDDVVTVKLFVSRELPPEVQVTVRDVRDVLSDFRRASGGDVRVEVLHPDESDDAREQARSLEVRSLQFNVLRGDEYQVKQGWLGIAVLHAGESETIPVVRRTTDLEYRLASAITSLTAERQHRVAFLSGFGAGSATSYPQFRRMIARNYEVSTVRMAGDSVRGLDPDSLRVVVLAGPNQPLSDAALDSLDAYLDGGGSALVLAEGVQVSPRAPVAQPVESGIDSLLLKRGVRPVAALVYDTRSHEQISTGSGPFAILRGYPFWPVVQPAKQHLITRGLQRVSLGWARPLEVVDSTRVEPLLVTTEYGGRRAPGGSISPTVEVGTDPSDLSVQTVAVAVRESASGGPNDGSARSPDPSGPDRDGTRGGTDGRLVIVGDATFLESNFAQASRQNLVFAANALDWLAQDQALIEIRSKDRTPPPLVFRSGFTRDALKWGNLAGVPLLFVLIGSLRILRRRQLARRGGPTGPGVES